MHYFSLCFELMQKKMKLKLFILFCILQSISGATIPSEIGYPPLSNRIVGGVIATVGQAPYQCSLQRGGRHYCGCAIISEQWILTSGFCLAPGISGVQILMGTNDLLSGGVRYTPKKYIIHENYNRPRLANDIALVQVDKIQFSEKIRPIKYSSTFIEEDMKLLATGWGSTRKWGPIPRFLHAINLTAITNERCKSYHGSVVHDSHLCTYTRIGEGICNGDAGNPLVRRDETGELEVVGLANWAVLCARGYPDGFARISYQSLWIQEKIQSA